MKKTIAVLAFACALASCGSNEKDAQIAAQQHAVDSMKAAMVKQQTIDSMNALAAQPVMVSSEQPTTVSSHRAAAHHAASDHAYGGGYTSNTTNNYNTAPAPAAEAPHKKGWSAKAKGAVIGTGVGAITGAMVDKKKGEGAVVGGLIGAAAGLGAGAIIDNKKNK